MPKYLMHASYTPDGLRGLLREGGSSRRAAVEATVTGLGGTLEAFYYAFGDADAYVLADLPDNASANALSIAINQSGMAHLKTTVLMTPVEVDQAVAKAVDYRAPGQ